MSAKAEPPPDAAAAAFSLACALEKKGCEYALGGAIALGYWGQPRGTVDVDLTVFLPPDRPYDLLHLLQELSCEFSSSEALKSLNQFGFCHVRHLGIRVDVFLPTVAFYEEARKRRRRVALEDAHVMVWSPEVLAVFKMMFFREKDHLDLKKILQVQGSTLDRSWIRGRLEDIFGKRDVRVTRWDELCSEVP